MKIEPTSLWFAVIAFAFSGCLAEVRDKVLSAARSPSGKWAATVVDRDAGVMSGSIIVFLHSNAKPHGVGEALIAVTDGLAPTVEFVDDTTLLVRLFSGTKHNQRTQALGITILYE